MSPDHVCAILKSVHVARACGRHGISSRIASECVGELSMPLAKLCDMSLQQGVFPIKWKQTNIKKMKTNRSLIILEYIGKILKHKDNCFGLSPSSGLKI